MFHNNYIILYQIKASPSHIHTLFTNLFSMSYLYSHTIFWFKLIVLLHIWSNIINLHQNIVELWLSSLVPLHLELWSDLKYHVKFFVLIIYQNHSFIKRYSSIKSICKKNQSNDKSKCGISTRCDAIMAGTRF